MFHGDGMDLVGRQSGNGDKNSPGAPVVAVDVQIFCSDPRVTLSDLPQTLHQLAFANPRLLPLWSIQTPEMAVYSQDSLAAEFFAKVSAHNLGVLAKVPDSDTHMLFYALDETPARICARQLRLSQPPPNEPVQAAENSLASVTSPHSTIPSPAPIVPTQCGIDGPRKALQQTILGAMRLRGIDRSHRDYKSIYQHCLRAAEFSLRNCPQPISLDAMRDKVEALLAVLE